MRDSNHSHAGRLRALIGGVLLLGATLPGAVQADQTIYADSLQNGWENWSWSATVDLNSGSQVHTGAKAVSVSLASWGALSLYHATMDTSPYANLSFWIHGGSAGGQRLRIYAELGGSAQSSIDLPVLTANTWQQVTLSLTALGAANQTASTRFSLQDRVGTTVPTFYVDDIILIAGTNPPSGTSAPVAITVNAALNQHSISPLIYGVAFASASQLAELNAPLNRWGGNSTTRYNWQLNADNKGNDWYFQSIGHTSSTAGAEADNFISATKTGGADPVITIPMVDWMPRLASGRGKRASFSIAKYGPQTGNDWQWFADAGNGIGTNSGQTWLIVTNDPTDANYLTNSAFQQAWVRHLTNSWGRATHGGVRYYCMDNEHTLWHSTHRDIHPVGTTMQEIRNKLFDYGAQVKAADPNALLLAPEEWGWPGYLYSGYDWQWAGVHSNWNAGNFPDRTTNGGWDYGPWLLNQARQYELTNGVRLLDVFTYHIYPQGANQFTDDVSASTQLGRNRSTRALWDTNYVDESWINAVIKLIPRMRGWVATYYPGTKIGITEYNWGAESHINGATAQADLLGIFGRESLDLATRWTTPTVGTPAFNAIKMYRNYDGNKSTFGDTSISASAPSPDEIATFAALRSADGALTIMAINKMLASNAPVTLMITNFLPAGTVQVWQLTSANSITRLGDVTLTGNILSNTLPAQSITLLVIPGGAPPQLRDPKLVGSDFSFWLDGVTGQRYALQGSSDLLQWFPLQTNLLSSNSLPILWPTTNTQRFFRAQWVP
jgi:hypothetical protein